MNAEPIAFHRSLRGRLLLFIVLPMVLISAGVMVFRAINTFAVVSEQAQVRLYHLAEQLALEIERGNNRAVVAAELMAVAQEEGLFGRRAETSAMARRVLHEYPEFTGAYFGYEPNADQDDGEFKGLPEAAAVGAGLNPDGRFIPYWFRDESADGKITLTPLVDMETSLYYDGCRALFRELGHAAPMITEPYVYEGKMIVEQTYPILIDGRFVGVAGVDRALSDIAGFIEQIALSQDVDVYLVSSRGRFIATTLGLGLRTNSIEETDYRDLFARYYSGRARSVAQLATDPIDGERYYFTTAPIPTGDWMIVVRKAEREVLGPIRANIAATTSVASAGLLAIVALAWWFSASASRRIRDAMRAADRAASGDLSEDLTGRSETRDEIGSMFRSFNRVVESYRQVSEVCSAIAAGDFSQRLERRGDGDSLADAINLMADRRQAAEEEVSAYTSQLESRTTELERMKDESEQRAAIESSLGSLIADLRGDLPVGVVAARALTAMVGFLAAPAGALFVMRNDGRLHRLASHAYPDDSDVPTVYAVGSGTVGQAAESRRPAVNEPGAEQLRVAFGFGELVPERVVAHPLIANDAVVGVVELCLFTAPDETQARWLEQATETVASAIRFATESDELKEAEERTRLLLESAAEGIFGVDDRGAESRL
jgi:two-component system NtrC family sensor kinase